MYYALSTHIHTHIYRQTPAHSLEWLEIPCICNFPFNLDLFVYVKMHAFFPRLSLYTLSLYISFIPHSLRRHFNGAIEITSTNNTQIAYTGTTASTESAKWQIIKDGMHTKIIINSFPLPLLYLSYPLWIIIRFVFLYIVSLCAFCWDMAMDVITVGIVVYGCGGRLQIRIMWFRYKSWNIYVGLRRKTVQFISLPPPWHAYGQPR